jgi:hypothetical protein
MAETTAEGRQMTAETQEMATEPKTKAEGPDEAAESQPVEVPPEVAEARRALDLSRQNATAELDELVPSLRRSLDFPAKFRRDPVRTAGIVGGAAFLLLGGPRRTARAVEKRFFPRRAMSPPRLVPKNVEKTLDRLEPGNREYVSGHLERDFAAYLKKEHPAEPADARRSLWRTYDLLLGSVGAAAMRELVKRLFDPPRGGPESE